MVLGAAEEDREVVADELVAAVGEDGWTGGQARPLLLAVAGQGASTSTLVWLDAGANLGAGRAKGAALRFRLQKLRPKKGGSRL